MKGVVAPLLLAAAALVGVGAFSVPAEFFGFDYEPEPDYYEGYDEAKAPALACNITDCVLPACRCSSVETPGGLSANVTPQIVVLTFDDAVLVTNIDYYREALNGRRNPNNCSISATFFVSHEYTNYALVHELHAAGHEIGLHSITHYPLTDYWRDATVENLTKEFADQRLMMTRFASIPATEIKGIRMPFLQMAGNAQMDMLQRSGFQYDLSRGTMQYMSTGLWPYTHKYKTTQECLIGPCSTESYPNVWAVPMVHWENDIKNLTCSMADACVNYNKTQGSTLEWMKREFNKQYQNNRAPVGMYIHAAWFQADPQRFVEYKQFLDYLRSLNDVYIMSATQLVEWVKAPKTITQMRTQPCQRTYEPTCNAKACRLFNTEGNERWMTSCAPECPVSFPWYGNPFGTDPLPEP